MTHPQARLGLPSGHLGAFGNAPSAGAARWLGGELAVVVLTGWHRQMRGFLRTTGSQTLTYFIASQQVRALFDAVNQPQRQPPPSSTAAHALTTPSTSFAPSNLFTSIPSCFSAPTQVLLAGPTQFDLGTVGRVERAHERAPEVLLRNNHTVSWDGRRDSGGGTHLDFGMEGSNSVEWCRVRKAAELEVAVAFGKGRVSGRSCERESEELTGNDVRDLIVLS